MSTTSRLKKNEIMRQLRYNYTQDERLERGRQLADEYQELDSTNVDLDRVKKEFKARIEKHEGQISTLADQVRSGYELRDTLCFWEFDLPIVGKKQLRRSDTMEVIETADMTDADKQLVMDAVEDVANAATRGSNLPQLPEHAVGPAQQSDPRPKGKKREDNGPRRNVSGSGVVVTDEDGDVNEDESEHKT